MSRNRAAPSLVGETDRHSRSGGPRGRAGGRADGQGAGLAGRRTLGWVSAIVQVGGGGLLCFLRGSGEGRQDSKVGRRAHLPGPDLTGPAPVQTHRAPQALRSRPPTPYRLTQRLLQAHARVRTCASWPALARSPGSRPARAAGRPRGGWAAHLLKRRWASQQRLHRSSTPDSTTSVPPTKSDMTTTSSTELSRMGSGSACGPARVRTAGVAAGGPPCPSPPHSIPLTHGGAAGGVVPPRGQGNRGSGAGGSGHDGRGLHFEARRRGLGGQGLLRPAPLSPPPPSSQGVGVGVHLGQ